VIGPGRRPLPYALPLPQLASPHSFIDAGRPQRPSAPQTLAEILSDQTR
jgi:hypothetical protein